MFEKYIKSHGFIFRDLFSKTYRAKFSLNGEYKDWNITRIAIPFDENAENYLQSQGFSMESYYDGFAEQLCKSIRLVDLLHTEGSPLLSMEEQKKIKGRLLDYIYIHKEEYESGSILYIITEADMPVFGGGYKLTRSEFLEFAVKITELYRVLIKVGICFSYVDPFSFVKRDLNGTTTYLATNLIYCAKEGERLWISDPHGVGDTAALSKGKSIAAFSSFLLNTAVNGDFFLNGESISYGETLRDLLISAKDSAASEENIESILETIYIELRKEYALEKANCKTLFK